MTNKSSRVVNKEHNNMVTKWKIEGKTVQEKTTMRFLNHKNKFTNRIEILTIETHTRSKLLPLLVTYSWPYVAQIQLDSSILNSFSLTSRSWLQGSPWKFDLAVTMGWLYDFDLDLYCNSNNTMDDDFLFTFELTG